ncbi:NAD(H) kinase 3 isoform X1 [Tasmannia lanceolata]|uniref:NAD(H) kinase 3 isoform X1 n=1 Tax=Tasmannia lanceolata TaxID=3420 RepID=UPI0040629AAF
MSIRRVLLLLKPLDVYPTRPTGKISSPLSLVRNPQILGYLDDRCRIHKDTINFCQDVLQRRSLDWKTVVRNNLSEPIRHVDLVITIGGDGTLLQASHFMDDSIPMLGVNSDPTQVEEVKEFSHEFDATRSTGYLCAATAGNFEQVFDEVLEGCKAPSELSRMSISLNGQLLSTCALNDVLVAHPCPAAVSRFSFLIKRDGQRSSSLVSCRSSGLRVSTATGSTAAMLSAGGFLMPILSQDLQYIVREPISPGDADSHLMHGVINSDQTIHVTWCSKEGIVYIDGSHVFHLVEHGDIIELSSKAPILKVFLPSHLLS